LPANTPPIMELSPAMPSLGRVHADYVAAFDLLLQRARDQLDV
jgi:hypothetical protein